MTKKEDDYFRKASSRLDSKYSQSSDSEIGDTTRRRRDRRRRKVNVYDELTDSMEGLSDEYSEIQKNNPLSRRSQEKEKKKKNKLIFANKGNMPGPSSTRSIQSSRREGPIQQEEQNNFAR